MKRRAFFSALAALVPARHIVPKLLAPVPVNPAWITPVYEFGFPLNRSPWLDLMELKPFPSNMGDTKRGVK